MGLPETGRGQRPFSTADALDHCVRSDGNSGLSRAAACRSACHRAASPGRPPSRLGHRGCRDFHDVPRARSVENDLQLATWRPLRTAETVVRALIDLGAPEVCDDPVAAVRVVSGDTVPVHRQPDSRAPTRSASGSGQFLYLDVRFDTSQSQKLLPHDRGLHLTLDAQIRMRVVAAARPARAGDRACRIDPMRRSVENGDRVGAAERSALVLGHPDQRPLPRQTVTDEHDPPLVPGDDEPAVTGVAQIDLEGLSGPILTQRTTPAISMLPIIFRR